MIIRWVLLAVFVALHISAVTARADEPPSWAPFEVCSDDGRYCAEVAAIAGDTGAPWNRSYNLKVRRLDGGGEVEIWTAPYRYDGYPGGVVASNGKAFVYVSQWFYPDDPIVRIYREDGRLDLVGSEFDVPSSMLVDTASHQLWLSESQPAYELTDDEKLQVRTIDGVNHLVGLTTGALER